MAQRNTERDRLLAQIGILTGDRVMAPVGQAMFRQLEVDADQQTALEQQAYNRTQDILRNSLAERRLAADLENAELGRRDRLQLAAERLLEARGRAAETQAARADREADRASTNRDRALERLTKTLDSQGYSELHQSLSALNNVVGQYPEGKNIPGIGGAANVDKFGIGTALTYMPGGGGSVARDNQSTAAAVKNAILKARSGGAVTAPEADRLLNELSQGVFSTDQDFRSALKRIVGVLNAKVTNVFAGYSPDVIQEYRARGGQVGELSAGATGGWSAQEIP